MKLAAGKILMSTAAMDDPNFKTAIVFITEYNNEGATGFVINKPFGRNLNELVEFISSPPFPLYAGGPVDKEHLFFIHRSNKLIPGGTRVTGNIYFGGDFKTAIGHINNGTVTGSHIKICIGYCGWDTGELEAEIAEGCWELAEAEAHIIFDTAAPAAT